MLTTYLDAIEKQMTATYVEILATSIAKSGMGRSCKCSSQTCFNQGSFCSSQGSRQGFLHWWLRPRLGDRNERQHPGKTIQWGERNDRQGNLDVQPYSLGIQPAGRWRAYRSEQRRQQHRHGYAGGSCSKRVSDGSTASSER